jgi:hypothetical protein
MNSQAQCSHPELLRYMQVQSSTLHTALHKGMQNGGTCPCGCLTSPEKHVPLTRQVALPLFAMHVAK